MPCSWLNWLPQAGEAIFTVCDQGDGLEKGRNELMSTGSMKPVLLKHGLRGFALVGLWLASAAAMALGLGEIRVLSQPGQPLVAEIPVISNEPGELEQLQARLASPGTFERVGLARPEGLVNGLGFAVALDAGGRPVIRVTSDEPVRVDSVNFLVEVDWGQGRLVREYSALVSGPGSLAAGSQPRIEAPLPAPANTIIREPDALAGTPDPVATAPEPAQAEAAPAPATAPRTASVTAPPTPAQLQAEPGAIRVADGQTLSQIARGLALGGSLDETMIALLRANPEAFLRGNINLLRAGAVLRVPAPGEVAQLAEGDAAVLVREQNAQWRSARAPIPQPAATAAVATPAGDRRRPDPAPAVAQARLEIAPPAASAATRAGTQSGIDAEGEGDMLANQELTATKEDLAARQSEVEELRAQVAELETLKQQQSQLIAMKDSELAAAQQRLAQDQGNAGQPLWLWAGLLLLAIGLVVAYLMGRRKVPATVPERRSGYDSAALAAAFNPGTSPAAPAGEQGERLADVDFPAAAAPAHAVQAAAATTPAWEAPLVKPTWHTGDAGVAIAPMNPAPAGRERLELARAYIDLGDTRTARDLLDEVVAGGDAQARDEASQLLRELG